MTPSSRSTVLRLFGVQVAMFRESKGMSQSELGAAVGYSKSQISAIEQGTRIARRDLIAALDRVLDADGHLNAMADDVAEQKYLPFFVDFAAWEAGCFSLDVYATVAIPGLLQTEAHARAVIGARCPPLDDEEIERRVQARVDRQALLTRRPPAVIGFVIEEHLLRRPLGGPEVHREQLGWLLECAALRNVSLQVMPMGAEVHAGLDGPLILLTTEDRQRVAYIEGQAGGDQVTDPEEVRVLDLRYGIIRGQALSPERSVELIKQIMGEI